MVVLFIVQVVLCLLGFLTGVAVSWHKALHKTTVAAAEMLSNIEKETLKKEPKIIRMIYRRGMRPDGTLMAFNDYAKNHVYHAFGKKLVDDGFAKIIERDDGFIEIVLDITAKKEEAEVGKEGVWQ